MELDDPTVAPKEADKEDALKTAPQKVVRKKFTPEELDAVDLDAPQYYLYRNREVHMSLWDDIVLTLTFPLGLVRAIIVFSFLAIWLVIATISHAVGFGDAFIGLTGGICNYIALHIAGFFFKIKGIENYRTALQHGRDENRPLVVISNHISALDPHAASGALWSCFRPVVKKDVLSIPLYGGVARTLGSIGVDRTKASGVVNTLRSYIADNGHDAIPLYLCPEASTTNGEGLLRFKRGTFLTDTEVLPVCLQYQSPAGVSVCLNQPTLALDILQIIRFMSCVRPKYICATILPPMRRRHGEDYQAFADRVGRAMAAAMGIKYELERTYEEALLFYTALEHQYRHRTGKFAPGRADATKKNNKKKNK